MYDFDRIVKAAESCDFHDAFASDIKRCENALGMAWVASWQSMLNVGLMS